MTRRWWKLSVASEFANIDKTCHNFQSSCSYQLNSNENRLTRKTCILVQFAIPGLFHFPPTGGPATTSHHCIALVSIVPFCMKWKTSVSFKSRVGSVLRCQNVLRDCILNDNNEITVKWGQSIVFSLYGRQILKSTIDCTLSRKKSNIHAWGRQNHNIAQDKTNKAKVKKCCWSQKETLLKSRTNAAEVKK